jgi:uncharacterized protein YjbJ (UPF0337 family)
MNWDQVSGQMKQLGADIKSRWAKLTDDDLQNLGAKKDMFVAKIQERYGILKEEAETQVDEWLAKLNTGTRNNQTPRGNTSNDERNRQQSPKGM